MLTLEFTRTLYPADADSAHDFDHVLRVVAMADRIAQAEGADRETVRAAALLHDIGLDAGRAGHETSAANRAKEILREHGYAGTFCESVAHAIESHRFRSGPAPQTLEAKVLFDADKLDAIGAIGVARAYAMSGMHHKPLWAEVSADYAGRQRTQGRGDATSEGHTAVHEFVFKLSRLKDTLFTDAAKRIAVERHRFMDEFFARLSAEVKGER